MPKSKIHSSGDCATVWFLALERARNLGDIRRAKEAEENLRRLGVTVTFRKQREAANA